MDRQIVYVGAVPMDTDQLLQSRHTMTAIGYLAKMMVGDSSSYADGFTCNPAGGLSVSVGPGSMTVGSTVDDGPFGSLPPDTAPLLKIGINIESAILTLPSSGNYTILANFLERGAGETVLPFYNANNPSITLLGSQGDGSAQPTVLQQRVAFSVVASGAVSGGGMPLWNVAVPAGATAITSAMISAAPDARFITVKLPQAAPLNSPTFTGLPAAPTPVPGDATGAIATTAFVTSALQRNRAAWGTGGAYHWVCPTGVNQVLLRAWGAGGSGGNGGTLPGGGGGGGGYVEVLLTVAAGQSYAIQIGSGTTGASSTQFGDLVTVLGGGPGGGANASQAGNGGVAGLASVPSANSIASMAVAAGQAGFQIGNTNVGGAGGSSFGTAATSPCFASMGPSAGLWPGGGGAGGAGGSGAAGADGLLILEWLG